MSPHRARARRDASKAKKTVVTFALSGALLSSSLGATGLLLDALPWLTEPEKVAAPQTASDTLRTVGAVSTPAADVVTEVVSTSLRSALPGATPGKVSRIVPSPSLGFGCDPKDGLSPAVAATRTWRSDDQVVSVAVRAYPAGAGAAALDAISHAAYVCTPASTWATQDALGVQSHVITSTETTMVIWRRGDVLVSLSDSTRGRAGSLAALSEAATRLDAALDTALSDSCTDTASESTHLSRSPYQGGTKFTGLLRTATVTRPESGLMPAEERTPHEVVDIPSPDLLDAPVDVPVLPDPAPTQGPTALPEPVEFPATPSAPDPVEETGKIRYPAQDTYGPGCGWNFTAQAAPNFDAVGAQRVYDERVGAEQDRLDSAWRAWQKAKMRYYRAWAAYTDAAEAYTEYAAELAAAREAWDVVETARAEYATAMDAYTSSVVALEEWLDDVALAQQTYDDEVAACTEAELLVDAPDPLNPDSSPAPLDLADLGCPPQRPEILDQPRPELVPFPTPAPQAQLPAPSTQPSTPARPEPGTSDGGRTSR